ncbi:MAG: hypothetical protein ACKVRP_05535 [Bacteroidota bacterium]
MKLKISILLFASLILAACEKPSEVELIPPGSEEIEISAVSEADTNVATAQVDSGGILPSDHRRFAGRLTITKVTYDAPTQVQTIAFSRVILEDRLRPVQILGRTFGYHGFNLGQVMLNNGEMLRIPHRVQLGRQVGDPTVVAGFEYVADLTTTYNAEQQYTWTIASPDSVNPFSPSIQTPADLTVQYPRGGAIISRNEDLTLRWRGRGNIIIVISGYDPIARRTRPFLNIRPRANNGRAVIGSKFLKLLPTRFQYYTFTFILANRDESVVVGRFQSPVLVQAACVYNSFVELR